MPTSPITVAPSRRTIVVLGVVYLAIGLVSSTLAKEPSMTLLWRRAAYFVSSVVFLSHVWWEFDQRRQRPLTTALHAALAVAIGAFGIAAAANIRALSAGTSRSLLLLLSLILWPAVTAIPAFVVAFTLTFPFRRRASS